MRTDILRNQIPEGFYRLFAKKSREYLMDCLIAIYTELFSDMSYSMKGFTWYQCKSILISMPQPDFDPEEDIAEEEDAGAPSADISASVLRFLTKTGWLQAQYDEECGEDLYTIPEYSKQFIRVFQTISDEIIRSSSTIRSVYSDIVTYQHGGRKDQEFLASAVNSVKDLNVGLFTSSEQLQKKIELLMASENSAELLRQLLASLQENDKSNYGERTDQGWFRLYQGNLIREIDKIRDEIYAEERKIDDLIEQSNTERPDLENRQKLLARSSEMLRFIRKEAQGALVSFNALIGRSSDMCIRALQKLKYLNARNSTDDINRLMQLINILAEEKETGSTDAIDDACKVFAFNWEPDIFMDHDLYIKKELAAKAEHYVIPDKDDEPDAPPPNIKPPHTVKELRDFERSRTKDGHFKADSTTVTSEEEFSKLLYLFLDRIGTIHTDAEDDDEMPAYVSIKDGLGFTEISWEV